MTKVERIAEQLRDRISAGEWPSGAVLPSRGDLAVEYAVSPATITGAIRELQKEGRVRVLQGKGAFVAEAYEGATCPIPGGMLGLTGSYVPKGKEAHWFTRAILDGIWQEANERHCPVVLLPELAMAPALTRDYCRQLGVQGLVFLGGEGYANARYLKEEGFPVILSNKPAEPTTLNYVDYDNSHVIREVARRFIEAGHRRIGVVYSEGSVTDYFAGMRLHFLDTLMQLGAVYDLGAYWRGVHRQPGKGGLFRGVGEVVSAMLDLEEPPTAFFCWEPGMTPALLRVLEKRKLRVPEEVSVLVSSHADASEMEFSGFVMPHRELGAALVRHLCATVENPHHGVQELLKPRFVDHGTVAAPKAGRLTAPPAAAGR